MINRDVLPEAETIVFSATIQDFFWHISAEIASNLAFILLFPRLRIFMPIIDPFIKLLEDSVNQAEILSCLYIEYIIRRSQI
jgi:hypothetical protein